MMRRSAAGSPTTHSKRSPRNITFRPTFPVPNTLSRSLPSCWHPHFHKVVAETRRPNRRQQFSRRAQSDRRHRADNRRSHGAEPRDRAPPDAGGDGADRGAQLSRRAACAGGVSLPLAHLYTKLGFDSARAAERFPGCAAQALGPRIRRAAGRAKATSMNAAGLYPRPRARPHGRDARRAAAGPRRRGRTRRAHHGLHFRDRVFGHAVARPAAA